MIIRVELTTYDNRRVRAGYEYDDVKNEVTGIWCEDDTERKSGLIIRVPDAKDGGKVTTEVYADKDVKDVSADRVALVFQDGGLTLPFTFETSH